MNGIPDNMLPEHHVMKCIFHHHDAGQKKKMLGGVSFEGGVTDVGKGSHTVSQAGEQFKQPPFSDVQTADIGIGIGGSTAGRTTGSGASGRGISGNEVKGIADKHQKDTVSIIGTQGAQDKIATVKAAESATGNASMAAALIQIPVSAAAAQMPANIVTEEQPREKYRYQFDYKKIFSRLRNGIQTFLKGMEQKAGKENRKQPKKKEATGTRAVTKEEVYEIQINTAYLLDSYNKHGERSMLGKE